MADAPKHRWLWSSLLFLRITASLGCLVACIALFALWGRSFYWNDTFYRHHAKGYWHLRSWNAGVEFLILPSDSLRQYFGLESSPTHEWQAMIDRFGSMEKTGPESFGFGWGMTLRPNATRALAPHWFLAMATGALALALKPTPRLRFSLRQLLAITTLAAIELGAICSLHHWF